MNKNWDVLFSLAKARVFNEAPELNKNFMMDYRYSTKRMNYNSEKNSY